MFSSRQAAAQQSGDVWVDDQIPPVLRVQVSNIVDGALGTSFADAYSSEGIYRLVVKAVSHEHGRARLSDNTTDPSSEVHGAIRSERDILVWLDVVELCFRAIDRFCATFSKHDREMRDITIAAKGAVDELNERFRRAGFGYRYEGGQIFRIDSELLHQEATLPALKLLSDSRFSGADEEFRAAHTHFRAGEFKDCAVDALNAFESTMKSICDAKQWPYQQGARASDLLKVLRTNNLFPDFLDQSFDQLLATLKSGLPTVRNETGGHGQGAKPVEMPGYIASYALNLAAAKIRLLYEAFAATEK
jgi:AbiJ N-terminal domain 4